MNIRLVLSTTALALGLTVTQAFAQIAAVQKKVSYDFLGGI